MQSNLDNLHQLRVLVTRPRPQGEELCAQINAAGGKAICFPVIDIKTPKDPAIFSSAISHLNEFDWVIFISPQAVLNSVTEIKKYWPNFPETIKLAAIGAGTANTLKDANLPRAIFPKEQWNSEGLLDLSEFQSIQNKKIAIICGEGGRDQLEKELINRGAIVTRIIAYQRALPDVKAPQLNFDVAVCTSIESINNYKILFKSTAVPILVISERMQKHAQETGFKNIYLAKNASHHAILAELAKVKTKGLSMSNKQDETSDPKVKNRFPWGILNFLFSLVLLVALICVSYFGYFYLINSNKNANDDVVAMKEQLQHLQQNYDVLAQQTQQSNEALKNQTQALATIQQNQAERKNLTSMLEAQYLVKIANDQLQFSNNISLALKLLQMADQALREVSDAKSIREAIANDIATLQAIPQVDVVGLYARLSALNQQIDQLPLPTKLSASQESTIIADQSLPWWKRGLHQMWNGLSKIVIVRYSANGELPLVTPEQQDFLYQNMHAIIEKSMWALLHNQQDIFLASIQQELDWTKKYFIQDSPVTKAMENDLDSLLQINVHPSVPETLTSVAVLQNYLTDKNI